ncbi:MAG: T9SS type A sorting domain-containing protein [Chitinophagaceae bacterium]|jgi:hypothetical protein
MKKLSFSLLALLLCFSAWAQDQVYYVGHSLVGLDMPFQVRFLAKQKGINNNYRNHINIGTALKENWQDTLFNLNDVWDYDLLINFEHGSNHLADLPTISFKQIIITESVPLMGHHRDTSVKYASKFFELAHTGNPAIQSYLYATWEHADAGWATWRSSLTTLQKEWEDIADKSATRIGDTVFVVPGNLAMMALYDSLQKGPIGDKTAISQFFNDDIHLTFEGNYYMACLVNACVFHIDPRGTGLIGAGPYSSDTVVRNSALRAALQVLAWQTACKYPRSSLKCSTAASIKESKAELNFVYPNPAAGGRFTILSDENVPYQLMDIMGKDMLQGNLVKGENFLDCSSFCSGLYVLRTKSQTHKIIIF